MHPHPQVHLGQTPLNWACRGSTSPCTLPRLCLLLPVVCVQHWFVASPLPSLLLLPSSTTAPPYSHPAQILLLPYFLFFSFTGPPRPRQRLADHYPSPISWPLASCHHRSRLSGLLQALGSYIFLLSGRQSGVWSDVAPSVCICRLGTFAASVQPLIVCDGGSCFSWIYSSFPLLSLASVLKSAMPDSVLIDL